MPLKLSSIQLVELELRFELLDLVDVWFFFVIDDFSVFDAGLVNFDLL